MRDRPDKPLRDATRSYSVRPLEMRPLRPFIPATTAQRLSHVTTHAFFSLALPRLLGGFSPAMFLDFLFDQDDEADFSIAVFSKPWMRLPPGVRAPEEFQRAATHTLFACRRQFLSAVEKHFTEFVCRVGGRVVAYPLGRVSVWDPLFLERRALLQTVPPLYDLPYFGVQMPDAGLGLASKMEESGLHVDVVETPADPLLKRVAEEIAAEGDLKRALDLDRPPVPERYLKRRGSRTDSNETEDRDVPRRED